MKAVLLSLTATVLMTAAQAVACAAVDKDGKRCTRNPSTGSEYCWLHGGTNRVVQATARSESARTRGTSSAKKAGDGAQAATKREKKAKTDAEKKRGKKVEAVTSASPRN